MKEFTYCITDAEGIHARPAGELVKKAKRIYGIYFYYKKMEKRLMQKKFLD